MYLLATKVSEQLGYIRPWKNENGFISRVARDLRIERKLDYLVKLVDNGSVIQMIALGLEYQKGTKPAYKCTALAKGVPAISQETIYLCDVKGERFGPDLPSAIRSALEGAVPDPAYVVKATRIIVQAGITTLSITGWKDLENTVRRYPNTDCLVASVFSSDKETDTRTAGMRFAPGFRGGVFTCPYMPRAFRFDGSHFRLVRGQPVEASADNLGLAIYRANLLGVLTLPQDGILGVEEAWPRAKRLAGL